MKSNGNLLIQWNPTESDIVEAKFVPSKHYSSKKRVLQHHKTLIKNQFTHSLHLICYLYEVSFVYSFVLTNHFDSLKSLLCENFAPLSNSLVCPFNLPYLVTSNCLIGIFCAWNLEGA